MTYSSNGKGIKKILLGSNTYSRRIKQKHWDQKTYSSSAGIFSVFLIDFFSGSFHNFIVFRMFHRFSTVFIEFSMVLTDNSMVFIAFFYGFIFSMVFIDFSMVSSFFHCLYRVLDGFDRNSMDFIDFPWFHHFCHDFPQFFRSVHRFFHVLYGVLDGFDR